MKHYLNKMNLRLIKEIERKMILKLEKLRNERVITSVAPLSVLR